MNLKKHLPPGLYKLTVDGDARGFNWEELYVVLNQYGNVNQRTGPWDFDLSGAARPLVPAYWVYLNGRKLGLWYFNRPSFRQVRAKRMKGEAQFWIERAGDYEIRFEPHRKFTIDWADVRFEASPDDTLLDKVSLRPAAQRGLQRLFDETRWQTLAKNMQDPAFPYRDLLSAGAFDWALKHEKHIGLSLLVASYRLRADQASLDRVRYHVEKLLASPAWGNPAADGYSHNGDMLCSHAIRDLTFVLNFLHDELGAPLVNDLLARLDKQCEIFIELALLHHGYWGGSIVQDHGFTSLTNFTSAAYSLLGWLPRAEHWLRFCLPRMERTWRALPTDGVVPSTSFHMIHLYIDKVVLFRELHRQATGEDIYERPSLRRLVDYCVESYAEETGRFLHASARGDLTKFASGLAYFDQMARTFGDGDAAWLSGECRRFILNQMAAHDFTTSIGTLYAALWYEPLQLQRTPRPPRRLRWFADSGAVVYRDDARGILFSTRCGAPNSAVSYRSVTCPCDKIMFAHVDGNFAIARHGLPVIQTAEGGYSMRTELANVVLVDGQGQHGDAAFAMGYPDAHYGGQVIEEAKLDSPGGVGYVRMQLAPAYEGLEHYTREWFFEPDGRMRLVDTIKSRESRRFTWLFHTYRRHSIAENFVIQNGDTTLALRLEHCSTPLRHEIADTLTVWGYVNTQGDQACKHLVFETSKAVYVIMVEFVLS